MTFVMVAKPGPVTCTLLRMGLGLSLSICYAAIFTKTNRISRIFNRGIKAMVKRPSYTSPRSQVVICLCLVSVQVRRGYPWGAVAQWLARLGRDARLESACCRFEP